MPITAKLSRQFYEKFGDEVTNELVAWLNAVDDSYRAEFRDLFAANFGQVRAEMAGLRAELRSEMTALRVEMRAEMAALRRDMQAEMSGLRTELGAAMAKQKAEVLAWMFVFWIGTVGALLLRSWR